MINDSSLFQEKKNPPFLPSPPAAFFCLVDEDSTSEGYNSIKKRLDLMLLAMKGFEWMSFSLLLLQKEAAC